MMVNLGDKVFLVFFILMRTYVCIQPEAYGNGTMVLARLEYVLISCFGHTIDYVKAVPEIGEIHVSHVTINECRPTGVPYATGLLALNVQVASVRSLHLRTIPDQPQLNAVNLNGLPLEELYISSPHEKYLIFNSNNATVGYTVRPASDFLAPLEKLSRLNISRAVLAEPLQVSASAPLETVSLTDGKSLDVWGECSQMRVLSLTRWDVLTSGWLARCSRLSSLNLLQVPTDALPRVLTGARSLLSLAIIDCGLSELDQGTSVQLFSDLVHLQRLDLSNNRLESIQDTALESLGSLVELNLSHNRLTISTPLVPALAFLPGLRTLTLDHNPLGDWCLSFILAGPLHLPSGLRRLSLRATGATRLCKERQLIPDSLTYLDLAENEVKVLKFQSLPISRTLMPLEIDLRQNPIQEVVFRKEDYDFLFNKGSALDFAALTVRVESSVQCDCEHAWLARALRHFPHLSLRGLRCAGRGPFASEPPARLACDRWACADNCTCRRWWREHHAVLAHCTALHAVPHVPGLRELHAHHNSIDTLHAHDLPDSLLFLDLSNNSLSRADGAVAAKLFAVEARRVRLAGNPLACTCDNEPFLSALQRHRAQVEDFVNVTCSGGKSFVGVATGELCHAERKQDRLMRVLVEDFVNVTCSGGKSLGGVATGELCHSERQQDRLMRVLVASSALAVLALVVASLLYRYRREALVLLLWYLPSDVDREDLNDGRKYDVFVSFAHGDEELVMQQFLPQLERPPHAYSACVHYRDWNPGELIPSQIVRSVLQSRRTIIMLSNNFLQSIWGLLEFRTAHLSAVRESRSRIVIVLLEDVNEEELAEELRAYLRTSTYVRWDDPWFWQKLRYALPRRRISAFDCLRICCARSRRTFASDTEPLAPCPSPGKCIGAIESRTSDILATEI